MYTNQIIGGVLVIISLLLFAGANQMHLFIKRGYAAHRAAKAVLALAISVFIIGTLFIGSDS